MEKRNSAISITKSFAIILMVLGHSQIGDYVHAFIYMFHMPVFFFLSGYCFKNRYLRTPLNFIFKKVKNVWWPYVKWVVIFTLLHNSFMNIGILTEGFRFHQVTIHRYTQAEIFINCLNSFRFCHSELLLSGFWFLFTLFYASILFLFFEKYLKKNIIKTVVLLVLSFIFLYKQIEIPIFHVGAREFLATYFMLVGYSYKQQEAKASSIYVFTNTYRFIIISILFLVIGTFGWHSEMICLDYKTFLPYSFTAVSSSVVLLKIGGFLSNISNRLTEMFMFVGNHTLEILVWHLLAFKCVTYLIICLYKEPITRLTEFPVLKDYALNGWNVIYTLGGVLMPMGIVYLYNNYIKKE